MIWIGGRKVSKAIQIFMFDANLSSMSFLRPVTANIYSARVGGISNLWYQLLQVVFSQLKAWFMAS